MSSAPLYLVEPLGALRNHHALFLENQPDGAGTVFQVKGNIQQGMEYKYKENKEKPELWADFLSKSQLGWVKAEDLPRVGSICRANPPPAKQVDGPRRINRNQPLRRC